MGRNLAAQAVCSFFVAAGLHEVGLDRLLLAQQVEALFLQFDLFAQRLVGVVDGELGVAVALGIERAPRGGGARGVATRGHQVGLQPSLVGQQLVLPLQQVGGGLHGGRSGLRGFG